MMVQVGDILCRKRDGTYWLIYEDKVYPNDVHQLHIYVLNDGTYSTYTSPFGLDLPDNPFYIAA